jgi:outer membrane protein TolC
MFAPGNEFWTIGTGLSQPIFDGGLLAHRENAAKAAYDQAAAQYRGAVLAAFQNVADTLHAIENDGEALALAQRAENAAARSLSLTRAQLAAGQVSRLALLNAEVAYRQAQMSTIVARANQLSDAAALFQALGGAWWNSREAELN